MPHRTGWTLLSLTLASTSLLALTTMLTSGGCGQDADDAYATKPNCTSMASADPCTKVFGCSGNQTLTEVSPDGTACTLEGRSGTCNGGTCATPCSGDSECLHDTECLDWSCQAGKCAKAPLTPPDDGDPCTDEKCVEGIYSQVPKKLGEPCDGMGGVCDDSTGTPQCVECIAGTTTGCPAGELCFNLNGVPTCTSCGNGTQDGDETDVDCGGTCAKCLPGAPCKKCGLGQSCDQSSDNCNELTCVDTVCCENACGKECETCESGTGKCNELLTGTADVCTDSKVCAAGLGCRLRAGQACVGDNDCMSLNCSGTPKTCDKSTAGEPCVDTKDCGLATVCNSNKVCQ